jgi:DNA-binding NtrC family response regulator
MKDRDVIVIEDEEPWKGQLERWLREAGYNVRLACNQEEALAELNTGMIGVAIVDMSLVPRDREDRKGWKVAEEYAKATVPVVVISAYLSKREVGILHREGITDWYFDKNDFDKEEFLQAVDGAFILNEKAIKFRWHQIEKRFRSGD